MWSTKRFCIPRPTSKGNEAGWAILQVDAGINTVQYHLLLYSPPPSLPPLFRRKVRAKKTRETRKQTQPIPLDILEKITQHDASELEQCERGEGEGEEGTGKVRGGGGGEGGGGGGDKEGVWE